MSQHQFTRRLSLLAGSSFAAAGLSVAVSLGFAASPTVALAQVTCTATPTPSGNGTNAATIAAGTYNPGITCAYVGAGAAVTTGGAITVSSTAGGNGINLTATGSNAINWTSTAGTVTGAANTNGPVISAISAGGAINLTTARVTGTNATVSHGVYAESTDGGSITVVTGNVSGSNATSGQAAVQLKTTGAGDITYTSSDPQTGRLYGIRAEVGASGDLTISTGSNSSTANASAAVPGTTIAGIYAKTGTGLLTINGRGIAAQGYGVYIDAGGDVNFTGSGSATGAAGRYGVYVSNVAAGTTTTLNLSNTTGTVGGVFAQGAGDLVVNLGGVEVLNFNFSGMANPVPVTLLTGRAWLPPVGVSTVVGNFDLLIETNAALIGGARGEVTGDPDFFEPATVITFADPDMVLTNVGVIVVGTRQASGSAVDFHEAELRLERLNEFRHSGRVMLGAPNTSSGESGLGEYIGGVPIGATDRWYDDILSMPGVHWVGEGGEIVYDLDISRTQTNCDRNPVNGDLSASDCVKLVGGTTEGVTYVTLLDRFAGDRSRLNETGIVLVDVTGGQSAQGHFVVGSNTPGYSPLFGGSLDKGAFHFLIVYDEDDQQHKLVSVVSGHARQFPLFASAAQWLWRASTGSWFDRQADLRGGLQEGIGGGVWLRVNGESADREILTPFQAAGQDFAWDNTFTQTSYGVTGGVDLMSGGGDGRTYVVGLMGGYAHADMEYEASPNIGRLDAWTGGIYGSLLMGGLYVDATVNANNVVVDNDVPEFRLFPAGTMLSTRVISLGGQVEAGWRLPITESVFVEPLATVSYVRSSFDDFVIAPDDVGRPGLEVSYDDPTSLRAGLGGRIGIDQDFGVARTQVSLLGRLWNEFEGENAATLHNVAFPTDPDIALVDDISGQFNELAIGASVYSAGGALSGFLNLGGKFGDDYEARTGSVGVRVAW